MCARVANRHICPKRNGKVAAHSSREKIEKGDFRRDEPTQDLRSKIFHLVNQFFFPNTSSPLRTHFIIFLYFISKKLLSLPTFSYLYFQSVTIHSSSIAFNLPSRSFPSCLSPSALYLFPFFTFIFPFCLNTPIAPLPIIPSHPPFIAHPVSIAYLHSSSPLTCS